MATAIQCMPGYMVIDNFCHDPDAVRQSALAVGFGKWVPNQGVAGPQYFDGMCFWGDHSTLLRHLALVCGQPIYPKGMFFRVTNEDTEKARVHSDREDGEYTAIVYLSKHDPDESGTAFYRHRASGSIILPDSYTNLKAKDPEGFAKLEQEQIDGDPAVWEQIQYVGGEYNRCLIFDARLFHSRSPLYGIGSTAQDGRMVWVAHFNL
jgi:hypothetical protein